CSNFVTPIVASVEQGPGHPIPATEYWHGYHVQIPGKGSQELLRRTLQNDLSPGDPDDFPVVTKNHWMVECGISATYTAGYDPLHDAGDDAGEGFTIHTP